MPLIFFFAWQVYILATAHPDNLLSRSIQKETRMTSMHRTIRRIRIVLLNAGALSMLLTSVSGAVIAQDTAPRPRSQVRATSKNGNGITTIIFKTPQGQIRVALPTEIRPGDTILATTVLEPRGKRATDKDSNRAQLSAYTLSIADQPYSAQAPVLRWSLPANDGGAGLPLVLNDPDQQEVSRILLPTSTLSNTANGSVPNTGATSEKIILPAKGQAGRPLVFQQSFSGGTEDLHIWVGDKEARLLAASPRILAVESPRDVVGKTKLQVKRSNVLVAEGDFRNSRVRSVNPWGYILGAVAIAGIALAISANREVQGLQDAFSGIRF